MRLKIDLVKLAIGAILFVLLILSLIGCKVGEKAVNKYKESSEFPGDCADSFPVKTDSIYVEGGWVTDTIYNYDVQTLFDTVTQKIDTVIYKTKVINKLRVDTIRLTKEDSARIKQLLLENKELKYMHSKEIETLYKYLAESERKRKRNGKQALFGWGIISLSGLYHFRHHLLSLFSGPVAGGLKFIFGLFRRKKK